MVRRVYFLLTLLLATSGLAAAEVNPTLVELNKASFFYGREYFILRSGRAQMLLQADRADLGPAFTWMLFDAQDATVAEMNGVAVLRNSEPLSLSHLGVNAADHGPKCGVSEMGLPFAACEERQAHSKTLRVVWRKGGAR